MLTTANLPYTTVTGASEETGVSINVQLVIADSLGTLDRQALLSAIAAVLATAEGVIDVQAIEHTAVDTAIDLPDGGGAGADD